MTARNILGYNDRNPYELWVFMVGEKNMQSVKAPLSLD